MKGDAKLLIPRSIKGVVLFCPPELAKAKTLDNEREVDAILDSGASIPIVSEENGQTGESFQSSQIQLITSKPSMILGNNTRMSFVKLLLQ